MWKQIPLFGCCGVVLDEGQLLLAIYEDKCAPLCHKYACQKPSFGLQNVYFGRHESTVLNFFVAVEQVNHSIWKRCSCVIWFRKAIMVRSYINIRK